MMHQPTPVNPSRQLQQSLAKAERVFRDEQRRGCEDRLVQGGLEAFLRFWVEEVRQLGLGPEGTARADEIAGGLGGYRGRTPPERREALSRALGLLEAWRDGRPRPVAGPPSPGADQVAAAAPPLQAVPRTESPAPRRSPPATRYALDTPLEEVKGVGPVRGKALARIGLRRWRDLLTHYPNRHEYYPPARPASELLFVQKASYEGVVRDVQTAILKGNLRKISAQLADTSGHVTATWLRGGFSGPKLAPGQRVAISGNVVAFGRRIVFENPDFEPADVEPTHTRRMVPIYPLTSGIHLYWLRGLIRQAVDGEALRQPDVLPPEVRASTELPELGWAIAQMHFPDSPENLERARRRLAFDELFLIQLVVLQRRQQWRENSGRPLPTPIAGLAALLGAQPFELTGAQRRVLKEINADLARSVPMSRLLQGEVGSGKTAVAAAALFVAVAGGGQGVLMAPTEILAEQHYRILTAFFGRAEAALAAEGFSLPRVELLTGSSTRRQKEAIYLALKEGEIDVLVGTHAVIQEGVEPRYLALSIVDEQHRFGVRQRIGLREKGRSPHLLVMTATPIPRTLALSLHGDLDLSLIDELPPGRQKIKTHLLGPSERPLAYEHLRREADKSRQAFIICPLVEDSPNLEARAATEEYERLRRGELAELRLALLHGRMKPAEKDDVMRRFRDHGFDVLVSTSVVEVGVDIPNATTILIEGAERFGLAQLHQFRGRVGRGEHASHCILLTDLDAGEGIERLQMMVRSDNGLDLAEFDLRQRGPGDFFGVRQSGLPELRVATLNDVGLVERAREAADHLLEIDPDLSRPEHAALAARLAEFQERVGEPN